jgi:hypothetical protein
MKTEEEVHNFLEELKRRYSHEQYVSDYQLGTIIGQIRALKWVLEEDKNGN